MGTMERRRALAMLASSALGSVGLLRASPRYDEDRQSGRDHTAWVSDVLQEMLTIRPGMTRLELLSVFTTEGGLSFPLQRTYVSRACPYFKVDVTFRAVGRPERDEDGRVTSIEGDGDTIQTISRPYLQFSIKD